MTSFEAVINSLAEALIVFDSSGRVRFVNRTAEELLGRSSRDLEGKPWSRIAGGRNVVSVLFKKTIREGRSFRSRSVHMDIGRTINADITFGPYYVGGVISGAVLAIAENIGPAEGKDDDFDSLVYLVGSIAHEIKNPLGGIKGAAQLLRTTGGGAESREHIDLIVRETDRLNAILHDYLTLCRKPSFSDINIHEVIEKTLAILAVPLKEAGVVVFRSYDPSLPSIRGDGAKLLQVFLNIVKNAVEAMDKGGRIDVTTRPSQEAVRTEGRTQRWVEISISDTGKGIPEKDIDKIFLPFYSGKRQGTGLGLALSKKIIKDHGGMIRARSERDGKTEFVVSLPFER